jgi:hypothetical protein
MKGHSGGQVRKTQSLPPWIGSYAAASGHPSRNATKNVEPPAGLQVRRRRSMTHSGACLPNQTLQKQPRPEPMKPNAIPRIALPSRDIIKSFSIPRSVHHMESTAIT